MKNNNSLSGQLIKKKIRQANVSLEDVVVHVQKKGVGFSYPGLQNIFRDIFPTRYLDEILIGIAEKCDCSVEDFAESKAKNKSA